LWEFPGGKIEQGEDWKSAIERELLEELALKVNDHGSLLLSVRDELANAEIYFFNVTTDGEPILREHSDCLWATPAVAQELDLAPTDRRFVQAVLSGRLRSEGLNVGNASPF
jgi:8-oxo-dGTP diphosphatase